MIWIGLQGSISIFESYGIHIHLLYQAHSGNPFRCMAGARTWQMHGMHNIYLIHVYTCYTYVIIHVFTYAIQYVIHKKTSFENC